MPVFSFHPLFLSLVRSQTIALPLWSCGEADGQDTPVIPCRGMGRGPHPQLFCVLIDKATDSYGDRDMVAMATVLRRLR